jgi:hypothetical protein
MTTSATILSEFWHDQLVANGRQGLFLVLLAFLGSFAFIRTSARVTRSGRVPWWPGSVVSDSGVHLHHLVWGICLMLGAGTIGFAFYSSSPTLEICAVLFGIGAGFTVDEFALLVHLDDVYWTKEGRTSIDATLLAAAGMGLVLMGLRPLDIATGTATQTLGSVAGGLVLFGLVSLCFAKQRWVHGAIGFFFPPIAIYGAARIGKPGSPWARRFYTTRHPRKQAKADARFRPDRRTDRFKERLRDIVGGETDMVYAARLADEAARLEAATQLGRRADRLAAADVGAEVPSGHRPPARG